MTTVGALLNGATDRLTAAGVPSPAHDARELLAHVLDRRPPLLGRTDPVSPEQAELFAALLARRSARVPLQHLTGEAPFRYLTLAVGPGAFVPRPETEVMTGWAIDRLRERPADAPPAVVVDLCTGSGAIAKAVATEVPGTRVSAVELSPDAHAWAERNLADTDVTLLLGDMADALPELDGTVDLVICNPPYVPLDAYDSVVAEARDHDPDHRPLLRRRRTGRHPGADGDRGPAAAAGWAAHVRARRAAGRGGARRGGRLRGRTGPCATTMI